ncbi:transposase [Aliiruegeria haliotis]|uniref:transposase n=1 Tax=Aliiruegeria haliotis TaxID=1280846 RepID=UPI003182D084
MLCVLNEHREVVEEAKAACEPEAIGDFSCGPVRRGGFGRSGILAASQWLDRGLPPSCDFPGIGAAVGLTFKPAVDDSCRFRSPKRVGPWVGLAPSRNQSGARDVM